MPRAPASEDDEMRDLSCDQSVDLLDMYVEGTLSPEMRADMQRHLGGCADCLALAEQYERLPRTEEVEQRLRATVAAARRWRH